MAVPGFFVTRQSRFRLTDIARVLFKLFQCIRKVIRGLAVEGPMINDDCWLTHNGRLSWMAEFQKLGAGFFRLSAVLLEGFVFFLVFLSPLFGLNG